MRRVSLALLLLSLPMPAAAQDAAAVQTVRTLSACVTEHEAHLTRLVRLIDEAQGRTTSSDVAVRRDAIESITTLVGRAHEAREHLRQCVRAAHIPAAAGAVVEHTTTPDSAADSVATTGGSIHEIEANASLGAHVRVVRGERVDGSGTAADDAVRSAVHGLGPSFSTCYDAYVDRVGSQHGTLHLSFTSLDGGSISAAAVERGGFDAVLRQCVQRAAGAMHITGARGRSVFAYELSFGE